MRRVLYLDEDVSVHLVPELEVLGHEVKSTSGERRFGASDSQQLLLAAERGWVLVTHNRRDFRMLHDAWYLWSRRWGVSPSHAGILVVRLYTGQPMADVASVISTLLVDPSAATLDNSMYEWQQSAGWTRYQGDLPGYELN
jgi:hypothetical protein